MKRLLTTLLLVLAVAGISWAQRTVTGKVAGDDGEALVGATVVVKGAPGGTRTDVSGKYSIAVPAGATTLVVSYTGYTTQELALGSSNTVDVVMAAGIQLAETVVTALGISRSEKSVGYAISKVDGSAITGSGEVNAIEGLAAKVSGVQVVSSSGTPGASAKILIRGNSSLQLGNQPLLVVDNVPYDNSVNTVIGGDYPFNANLGGVNESNRGLDINPDDIESVSILKGPTASALYGTRAANGVILITTKKGKKGNLEVSYGFSYDVSEVNKLPDLQTSYGQGAGGGAVVKDANGVVTGSTTNGTHSSATPNSWGPAIADGQGNDNLATFFKRGTNATHNFSIGGGSDNTTFRFTYSNTSQTGIVPNTSLARNTFRVNASTGTEKFKVNVSGAYTASHDSKAQNGSDLSGVMLGLTRMPADFKLLGGTGPNGYDERDGSQHQFFSAYDNPAWSAAHNPNTSNVGRFTGSLGLDYLPLDWLTLTFRIGTDIYNDERRQIFDISNHNNDPGGELWQSNVKHEEVNTDFFARLHKTFGNFSTNFILGSQLNHRYDQDVFARGQEFAVPNYFNLNNASILYADNASATRRLAGVYGTLDIGYKDMLYLTVGARNDWASTFGPNAKNSFLYPNAALSFIPTEILAKNDILTYLKLRVSYAQAGREPNPYTSRTYYSRPTFTDGFTNGLSFPYLGANGFAISNQLGNTTLRPEINTSYETGADFRFWKNRATLNLTYYHSKSTDLLVSRPIASTSGFGFFVSNAGSMQNQGIEIEANVDIIKNKNGFGWSLGGNFTKNVNKVLALAPGVDQFSIESAFTGIGSYAIAGQPYGAIFGTQWARNGSGQLIIGANGLPTRNPNEGFLGNPYPDWTAGIRNAFTFKGITLSGLLDIRHGGSIWNGTYARLSRIGRTQESADGRANFYVIPGVKADGTPNDVRIGSNAYFATFKGDGGAYAVENAIQNGGWLRLREVTLSYALPKFSKYVKNLTIYFTGRNLWLKTDYKGVDPETSLTGAGSNIGGFDYFNMPGTKSYIFGLRSNF